MPSFLVINKSCFIDFSPLPPPSWFLFSESQRTGGEERKNRSVETKVDKLRDDMSNLIQSYTERCIASGKMICPAVTDD